MKRTLSIDIETFSSVDLKSAGMYKYAESENFEIMLFSYSVNNDPEPVCIDFTSKKHLTRDKQLPGPVYRDLTDPNVIKIAFNAPFEMTCIEAYFGITLKAEQWDCTMKRSAMAGLPLSLEQVGKALKLSIQKDNMGSALIRYFCIPCKPTIVNNNRTRNYPSDAPDKWLQFQKYCNQDVRSEMAVAKAIEFLEIPEAENKLWVLDQKINKRGIKVDLQFIHNALKMNEHFRKDLTAEALKISGIEKMSSVKQITEWLKVEEDVEITSLSKENMPAVLKKISGDRAKRILEIRGELTKTSIKKYDAMLRCICADGRIRGLFQFYGANRTGRWAGRLVQMQNLTKNKMNDRLLAFARQWVVEYDPEMITMVFGSIPDTLSQLIRTSFIAEPDCEYEICDYSAIEARVISWYANEEWRLQVFRKDGRIYEATAARMFGVPIEHCTKGNPSYVAKYRDVAKIAELACGFQGGVNAFIRMVASQKVELPEEMFEPAIKDWRLANPKIVKLWKAMQKAAVLAIQKGVPVKISEMREYTGEKLVDIDYGVHFKMVKNCLLMVLPSGRSLVYWDAKLEEGQYGPVVTYWGLNQETKQWQKIDTYGGKFCENLTQATARDILANGLMNLDEAGIPIVAHIHDESINENDELWEYKDLVAELMCKKLPWMRNLPLAADGFTSKFYKKEQ